MFEFISNGTKVEIHWIAAVLQIVAVYIIITIISFVRIKSALKSFVGGSTDDKLVKKCIGIKHQHKFHTNKNIYNLFSCILAALSLARGQKEEFFRHLNDVNYVDDDMRNRIYILMLSYITGGAYTDFLNECKSMAPDEKYTEGTVLLLYSKYLIDGSKVKSCIDSSEFNLNNQSVRIAFEELSTKLDSHKTGDDK